MSTLEMFKIEGKIEGKTLQSVKTLLSLLHHSPEIEPTFLSKLTGFSIKQIGKLKSSLKTDSEEVILQNILKWFFQDINIATEEINELKFMISNIR